MKVDYAIELLKNDLKYEVRNLFELRNTVHRSMVEGMIEMCHEIRNAIRLLNSENEVGVSDSSTEHGGLPHVRKWNASDEADTSNDESEQITLGKRIDSGKECPHCFDGHVYMEAIGAVTCQICEGRGTILKES